MAEDGEDDLKNAASDRQDAVLEASWRALRRYLGGLGAFLGSKVLSMCCKGGRPRASPTECAIAVKTKSSKKTSLKKSQGI